MRQDVNQNMIMAKINTDKINYSAYAEQYNCDPRTIKRYYKAETSTLPAKRKPRIIKKKTDDYATIIEEKFVNYHCSAMAIYKFLCKHHGYEGSYGTIRNYCRKLDEQKQKEAIVRFETMPGLQCQIDWKEELSLETSDGEILKVNIFLAVLGYSRMKYLELTLDRSQPTLFRCLTNSIFYFKGVALEFLFDNMKTVVDRSRTQFSDPVYNEKFLAFSKDAGFTPKSCIAYRPNTKGKVESVAKLVDRLKVYNKEFKDINELNEIVKQQTEEINSEVCSSTGETPLARHEREMKNLTDVPNIDVLSAYFLQKPLERKVGRDCLVTYANAKYSVPIEFIGKTVIVEESNKKLNIFYTLNSTKLGLTIA